MEGRFVEGQKRQQEHLLLKKEIQQKKTVTEDGNVYSNG